MEMNMNMNQGNIPPPNHMIPMNHGQQKIPGGPIPNLPQQFQRHYVSMPMEHSLRSNPQQQHNNPLQDPHMNNQRQHVYPNAPIDLSSTYEGLKKKFNLKILEFLKKSNYNSTANAFEQEMSIGVKLRTPQDIKELGFLFQMWCSHWDIFGDFKVRNSGIEKRPYENDMKSGYYQPNVRQGMPQGNSNINDPSTNTIIQNINGYPPSRGPPHIQKKLNSQTSLPQQNVGPRIYSENIEHYNRVMPMNSNNSMIMTSMNGPPHDQTINLNRQPNQQNYPPNQPQKLMVMNHPSQNGYHKRYHSNPMLSTNSLSNPPTPNDSMNQSIQSGLPTGDIYNPNISNHSPPSRNTIQEVSQPIRRNATIKEPKTKAKATVKKTRAKNTKETKKARNTSNQQSPPETPNTSYVQNPSPYSQGSYMDWSGNSNGKKDVDSVYSQVDYISENTSNYNGSNHLDSIHSTSKKHKSSEMDIMSQNEIDMTTDASFLDEVVERDNEDQNFIMNSLESSSDLLSNIEIESKSPLIEIVRLIPEDEDSCKLNCSSFNTTGKFIATGTSKSLIYVWDVERKNLLFRLNSSANNITELCFSPIRPNLLLSCSINGIIELWDCDHDVLNHNNSKSVKSFLSKDMGPIHSVDFHPFIDYIFCSSDSTGHLKIWNINKNDHIMEIKDAATKQARFSPSGQMIATGSGSNLKIYTTTNYSLLYQSTGHEKHILSVYWGEGDDTLITASEDSVKVWKITNHLELFASFSPPHNKNFYAIPHPLYMNSQVIIGSYKSLYIWEYSQNKQLNQHFEIHAHDGKVSSISSKHGKLLASTSHDSCLKLWEFSQT